jgi:molybdate transport system permease protein
MTDIAAVLAPLWLTLHLAALTTLVLVIVGTPFAWWLAHTRFRARALVEAVVALPLVLPPTALGFYLLLLMSPKSWFGGLWVDLTGTTLTFSFTGLVISSALYSLPFMVQPLQGAFETLGKVQMEAAAVLRAGPLDRFFTVAVPLALRGYVTGIVLAFAHTMGEFGVVLMVGGNIPGATRLVSIAIYEHVETLDYAGAHLLSAILLVISFAVLAAVFVLNRRFPGAKR